MLGGTSNLNEPDNLGKGIEQNSNLTFDQFNKLVDTVIDNDTTIQDLNHIHSLLTESAKYGLESEVIYFALQYMKNDSSLSIADAFTYGFDEWIK
jgi:hypothetical protein